ncbi:MFS transporter [Pseudonocardia sp. CA-107938]|uniref:MFS transporter n=1 Tax=Pseudonocardia sp. CA-107938 TaxID=3240021 RepID=UPI003D8A233C
MAASGLATGALPFLLGLAVLDRSLGGTDLGFALAARTVGFLVAVPAAGVLADRYSWHGIVGWSATAAAIAGGVAALGIGTSPAVFIAAAAVVRAGRVPAGLSGIHGRSGGRCRRAPESQRRDDDRGRVSVLLAPSARGHRRNHRIAAAGRRRRLPGPPTGSRRDERREFLRGFVEGLAEARRHPWFVAGPGALTAVKATGCSVTAVVLPLVSRDRYGTGAVLACVTTGDMAGALLGAFLIVSRRPVAPIWVAYSASPPVRWPRSALLFPFLWRCSSRPMWRPAWESSCSTSHGSPRSSARLLARVSSVDFLLSYGLAPLGLALIAPAVTEFGAEPLLAMCAAVCLIGPLSALRRSELSVSPVRGRPSRSRTSVTEAVDAQFSPKEACRWALCSDARAGDGSASSQVIRSRGTCGPGSLRASLPVPLHDRRPHDRRTSERWTDRPIVSYCDPRPPSGGRNPGLDWSLT